MLFLAIVFLFRQFTTFNIKLRNSFQLLNTNVILLMTCNNDNPIEMPNMKIQFSHYLHNYTYLRKKKSNINSIPMIHIEQYQSYGWISVVEVPVKHRLKKPQTGKILYWLLLSIDAYGMIFVKRVS